MYSSFWDWQLITAPKYLSLQEIFKNNFIRIKFSLVAHDFFSTINQDLLASEEYPSFGTILQSIWHQERRLSILPPVVTSSAYVSVLVPTLDYIICYNGLGCIYQCRTMKTISLVFVFLAAFMGFERF